MVFYAEEEEVGKCPKHPSRRRRTGVCHVCLRDRLSSLCPQCATARPCSCSSITSSSSRFSTSRSASSVGRLSSLIETDTDTDTEKKPAFRRSRSVAVVQFFRSNPTGAGDGYGSSDDRSKKKTASSSLSSVFRVFSGGSKSKRVEELGPSAVVFEENEEEDKDMRRRRRTTTMMMRKSRSVAVTSDPIGADVRAASSKAKGWHFPSPMKVFRQSISRGLLLERSPMYRG